MKTMTPRSDAPATPSRPRPRVRQLCAAAVVVPALALSACSGGSPVTATPSAPGGGSSTVAAAPAQTSPVTTSATTSAPPTAATSAVPTTPAKPTIPVDKTSSTDLDAVIKDVDLGHTVTAKRLVRQLSWPADQPVGAQQFEIVAVLVRFQAGSRYSATLEPGMLSLVAANPPQTVPPTTEFAGRWKATPLPKADRTEATWGWVFFKVNRGTTSPLQLTFNRPAYSISTTGKSFPAKSFSVPLTK